MSQLRLSLLGPFEATLDDKPIAVFGTDKTRALLAYLAVEAGRPHRREFLAGLLWGDQPEQRALHSLRQALSALRKALADEDRPAPFLLTTPDAVLLNPASDHWLDVRAFREHVDAALRHYGPRSATGRLDVRRLRQAATLYRGHFLDQFFLSGSAAFEEWATLQREALSRRALEAFSVLAEYHERRGEYALARQAAGRLVELAPWEETAASQLMRLLALDGQWSAAQAQYLACRRYLREELSVELASETTALYAQIRAAAGRNAPLSPRLPLARHNLPPDPTPFVGRAAELADIAAALADPGCRLLTLTGPGGSGKTRLALEAGREQVGLFDDGVYFVPLAALAAAAQIPAALADAIGLAFSEREDPLAQLLAYLRGKVLLLILDNLEHLLEEQRGIDLLADILAHAPGVVILATSRQRLELREECVYAVEGLAYPDPLSRAGHFGSAWHVDDYDALALFLRCARGADRRFAFTADDQAAAVRICQLVEGLPLGVELAAAAVGARSCEEIAAEITRTLDFLSAAARNVPDRQRSLRAAFEYSWQLLTPAAQAVFAALSIFRGGFTAAAAREVAAASPADLAGLVDRSLLRHDGAGRYDVHEALRPYAAGKLAADPVAQAITEAQHARHFAAFLAQQSPRLRGAGQKQALAEVGVEIENARRAWRWAVVNDRRDAIRQSVEGLYLFFDMRSRFREGVELFDEALMRPEGFPKTLRVWSVLLSRRGALRHRLGQYEQAQADLEQALDLTGLGDLSGLRAFCLVRLANVLQKRGRRGAAGQLAEEALALARQLGDAWDETRALFLLSETRYRAGEIAQAQELLDASLTVARRSGDPRLALVPLNALGDIACHRGDYARARRLFEECLALSRDLGDRYGEAMHLNNLGTVLHILGQYDEAAAFYRQSLAICRDVGDLAGQATALGNLGEVAQIEGRYTEARASYAEALAIGRAIQDQWNVMTSLSNLGETATVLGDYGQARGYLREALALARRTETLPVAMNVLVNLAALYARLSCPRRAADLLTLVLGHPASEEGTREKAKRLLDEMQSQR
ncbi:MAG: tetratricopeptide repeat protein [Chloroflexi bacterium]|nr:tetratricopeptide repeat protein [Chloroflexota bacterium]